jgi:hypothetical protein
MNWISKLKAAILKTLDVLFPATMNFIWGICFLHFCRKNGWAIFSDDEKDKALDYLVK